MSTFFETTRDRIVAVPTLGPILVVSLLLACWLQASAHRLSATNTRLAEPLSGMEIASHVPSGTLLRVVALGHNEAMADMIWLNALSFFGKYRSLSTDVDWLDPHIEAMIELDPKFRLVFAWAGTVIMYGGEINNESVSASNRFLELGVERFPYDWELRFMLGVNYYFELRPTTVEESREWLTYGAEQIAIAAGLPNAPPSLGLAAASMLRRRANWEAQVRNHRRSYVSAASEVVGVRTLRRHLVRTVPTLEAEALLRQRELRLSLQEEPRWPLVTPGFVLLLHPEPLYLVAPDALRPPPFHLSR
jgi:hypothetical protein